MNFLGKRQSGQTEQMVLDRRTGRTDRTDKLDFLGNLYRVDFAIFALFPSFALIKNPLNIEFPNIPETML